MFRILILYKDEAALERYIRRFYGIPEKPLKSSRHERTYANKYITIYCKQGLRESIRGYKVHFIAVQEELTWIDQWHEIRNCILTPMIMSPIPLQIFDGICTENHNQ